MKPICLFKLILLLLVILCHFFCCLALKCGTSDLRSDKNSDVFVDFPTDLFKPENDYTYVLKNISNRSFSINCSSFNPVTWKIVLANEYQFYQSVRMDFLYEILSQPQPLNDSENRPGSVCYTTSLVFVDGAENITGAYRCQGRLDENIEPNDFYNWYDVYSGHPESGNKVQLLYGGENITIETKIEETEVDEIIFECAYGYPMALPCKTNYPANITVHYRQGISQNSKEGWTVANENYECYESVAPEVTHSVFYPYLSRKLLSHNNNAITFPNGLQIKCTIGEDLNNYVLLNLLPTSEASFSPTESNATLFVREGDTFTFSCSSVNKIRIETNYPFGSITTNRVMPDSYLKYYSEIEILIPKRQIGGNAICNECTTIVSCIGIGNKTIQTWNLDLNLMTPGGNRRNILKSSLPPIYYQNDDQENSTFLDGFYNEVKSFCSAEDWYFEMEIAAAATVSIFFVPCETFIECQIKSNIFYNKQNHVFNVSRTFAEDLLTFSFPTCTTGLIRLVGFSLDVVQFVYVKVTNDPENHMGLLLDIFKEDFTKAVTSDKTKNNIYIATDTSKTFVNESLIVICLTPIMVMITHPYLEFHYSNNTQQIILPENIIESNSTAINGVMILSSEILVPSSDIIGINCVNYQYASMFTPVWNQAKTVEVAANFTSVRRKQSLFIMVEERPYNNSNAREPGGQNIGTSIALAVTLGVISILFVMFAVLAKLRIKQQKKFIDLLNEKDREYFFNGRPNLLSEEADAEENAQNTSYDQSKEINSTDLNIDYGTILGTGTFGIIYRGTLIKDGEALNVAVKMVKALSSGYGIRTAMAELKVMLYIPPHENIVKIIGACTRNLISNELLVVMEHCYYGDLGSYLQKHSKNFVNQVSRGTLKSGERRASENNSDQRKIYTTDLITWAHQIAKAMNHVAGVKVIHGDLATRNILLDHQLTAKLSDFGLSKKMYECPQYIRTKNTPLPWKWLSIEALKCTSFSTASDVWAYGVTLWEIFSLGASPYPGLEYSTEFVDMLVDGFRMPLPKFATYKIYDMILTCWEEEPSDRPSFSQLCEEFENLEENDVVEIPQPGPCSTYVGVQYAGA